MILLRQTSCVALGDRAVLIEGAPGAGKSSLALSLIDRGAMLIGDDGVAAECMDGALFASPPPRIAGLLEVRNLGLLHYPTAAQVRVALVLQLDPSAPRFIDAPMMVTRGGTVLPCVQLWPDSANLTLKAELALAQYGLPGADGAKPRSS